MNSIFFDTIRKISASQLTDITVTSDRCSDVSCKTKKICSACQDNCVVDAIDIGEGVEIDWDKCIKCGICAAVCPTEVFKIQAPSDNKILRSIAVSPKDENIIIECDFVNKSFQGKEKRQSYSGRKIIVPCIGRFSETFLLLSTLSRGDKAKYVSCTSDCSFLIGKEVIDKMWRRTENLFKIFEKNPIENKEDIHSDNKDQTGRRELLRETRFQAIELPLSQKDQSTGLSNVNIKTPPQRAELLQLIEMYSPPTVLIDKKEMHFSNIKLSPEKCRLNGICASVCPTDALQFLGNNQGKELSFKMGLCVGCEACVYICPEEALEIDEEIDLGLLSSQQTIMKLKYQLCTSCGKQFSVKTGYDSSICKSCIKSQSFLEEYGKDSKIS